MDTQDILYLLDTRIDTLTTVMQKYEKDEKDDLWMFYNGQRTFANDLYDTILINKVLEKEIK